MIPTKSKLKAKSFMLGYIHIKVELYKLQVRINSRDISKQSVIHLLMTQVNYQQWAFGLVV